MCSTEVETGKLGIKPIRHRGDDVLCFEGRCPWHVVQVISEPLKTLRHQLSFPFHLRWIMDEYCQRSFQLDEKKRRNFQTLLLASVRSTIAVSSFSIIFLQPAAAGNYFVALEIELHKNKIEVFIFFFLFQFFCEKYFCRSIVVYLCLFPPFFFVHTAGKRIFVGPP